MNLFRLVSNIVPPSAVRRPPSAVRRPPSAVLRPAAVAVLLLTPTASALSPEPMAPEPSGGSSSWTCPAGRYRIIDLGIFVGSWGACAECPADFNGDDVVDGADMGSILGAVCLGRPCARPACSPCPEPESESLSGGGGGAFTVETALALIGFASIEAFSAWSYSATFEQIESVITSIIVMIQSGSSGDTP